MSINFLADLTVDITVFLEAFVNNLVGWEGGEKRDKSC